VAFVVPLSILAAGSVVAQSVMESSATTKTTQVSQASASKPQPGMTKQTRLSLCLESWNAQKHVSRRQWRIACARDIKDHPGAPQK
jgi:hypothetical protein